MQFYRPAPLDPHKHDRDGFSCGDASLDEYLQKYAGQNRRGNNAATWVIADERYRVVCYATLSMSSVDRSAAPRRLSKGSPPSVPALLVGRLATDESVSGVGLCTQMVRHILATAVDLNLRVACRAVVVTALNPVARRWWARFGFVPFDPADDTNLDLYLLTGDIEATLLER